MIVKYPPLRSRRLRVIFHDRFRIAAVLDPPKFERDSLARWGEAHHNELALLVSRPRVCRINNFIPPKVVITDLQRKRFTRQRSVNVLLWITWVAFSLARVGESRRGPRPWVFTAGLSLVYIS